MGDLAAAGALFAQMNAQQAEPEAPDAEEVDSTGAADAASGAGTPAEAIQAKPEPKAPSADEAALRRQLTQERLDALRARRQDAKASKAAEERETRLKAYEEQVRKAAEQEQTRWKSAYENPIEGLKQLGYRPEQVYQQLTDHLLDERTPEAQQRQLMRTMQDMIREETGKLSPEMAEMKRALDEHKAEIAAMKEAREQAEKRTQAAEQRAREQEFVSVLNRPEYEDLQAWYTPDQLLQYGYSTAKMLYEAGLDHSYESTVKKMAEIHNQWYTSGETRSKAKKSALNKSQSVESGKQAPQESQEPAAIGNGTASAVASGDDRKLTKDERLKKAAQLLASNKNIMRF